MAEATLAVSFAPIERGLDVDHGSIRNASRTDAHVASSRSQMMRPTEENSRAALRLLRPRSSLIMSLKSGDEDDEVPGRSPGRPDLREGSEHRQRLFRRAREPRARVFKDGWLDTGDLGYLAWTGHIVITGRSKDLMIVNGRNIWPQDVEWAVEDAAGSPPGRCRGVFDRGPGPRNRKCRDPGAVSKLARLRGTRGSWQKDVKATADPRRAAVDGDGACWCRRTACR